jgi:hypothetical protein
VRLQNVAWSMGVVVASPPIKCATLVGVGSFKGRQHCFDGEGKEGRKVGPSDREGERDGKKEGGGRERRPDERE